MSEDKFTAFCRIMDTLLGEGGCPWDRAQTHESLRPYLLEECYEAADAIDQGDWPALCEELGDVLMEVVFHAKLAEHNGEFTMDDVIGGISDKLIRRHSHIFGEDTAQTAEEVEAFWAANKRKEKQYKNTADLLRAVPKALPALIRAEKVLTRADTQRKESASAANHKNGENSENSENTEITENSENSENNAPAGVYIEKARQLLDAIERIKQPTEHIPEQDCLTANELFGKLLFTLVRLATIFEINAEFSLTNQVEAFINTNSIECK